MFKIYKNLTRTFSFKKNEKETSFREKLDLLREDKFFEKNFQKIDKNGRLFDKSDKSKEQEPVSTEAIEKTLTKVEESHKNSRY